MDQRTDAAEVFGFLRKLRAAPTIPFDTLTIDRAFRIAPGLSQEAVA